jgi:uracil-DNA glycosylase family 4
MPEITSHAAAPAALTNPGRDCGLCPRLVLYRTENRAKEPAWHNAPVPSFGALDAELLIVGLAPGVRGANRTGRPFTGDYAGLLLYRTLIKFSFATGIYLERADDGLLLRNCRVTNAVRCVPPQNLPTPAENKSCNGFLKAEIAAMPRLRAILTLGTVAHLMSLRALSARAAAHKFAHGAMHETGGVRLFNSYHVSRYNTSTRRLSEDMFEKVVREIRGFIDTVV